MIELQGEPQIRSAEVLTRAVLRAAGALQITQNRLALALGVSEASISRLGRGRSIDPRAKEGELALLIVRLYRGLDALVGGEEPKARQWLHAHNHHLRGVPLEQIASVTGLIGVVEYLDAMRGQG